MDPADQEHSSFSSVHIPKPLEFLVEIGNLFETISKSRIGKICHQILQHQGANLHDIVLFLFKFHDIRPSLSNEVVELFCTLKIFSSLNLPEVELAKHHPLLAYKLFKQGVHSFHGARMNTGYYAFLTEVLPSSIL
jgi:hypothetical protein